MWIKLYLYSKKKENSWISDKIRANAKIQTYAAKDQIWLALCQHIYLDSNVYQPYYIHSLDIHCQKLILILITQQITLSNRELGHSLLQRCSWDCHWIQTGANWMATDNMTRPSASDPSSQNIHQHWSWQWWSTIWVSCPVLLALKFKQFLD